MAEMADVDGSCYLTKEEADSFAMRMHELAEIVRGRTRRSREVREDLKVTPQDVGTNAKAGDLSTPTCPSCQKAFTLHYRHTSNPKPTLLIQVYVNGVTGHESMAVKITCPHCGYEEHI